MSIECLNEFVILIWQNKSQRNEIVYFTKYRLLFLYYASEIILRTQHRSLWEVNQLLVGKRCMVFSHRWPEKQLVFVEYKFTFRFAI